MADLTKIVFSLRVPEGTDLEEFQAFMTQRYLPAVRMTATRVGDISRVQLYRGISGTHSPNEEFLLEVTYNGLSLVRPTVDDEEVSAAYDAYGVERTRLGAYALVGEHSD